MEKNNSDDENQDSRITLHIGELDSFTPELSENVPDNPNEKESKLEIYGKHLVEMKYMSDLEGNICFEPHDEYKGDYFEKDNEEINIILKQAVNYQDEENCEQEIPDFTPSVVNSFANWFTHRYEHTKEYIRELKNNIKTEFPFPVEQMYVGDKPNKKFRIVDIDSLYNKQIIIDDCSSFVSIVPRYDPVTMWVSEESISWVGNCATWTDSKNRSWFMFDYEMCIAKFTCNLGYNIIKIADIDKIDYDAEKCNVTGSTKVHCLELKNVSHVNLNLNVLNVQNAIIKKCPKIERLELNDLIGLVWHGAEIFTGFQLPKTLTKLVLINDKDVTMLSGICPAVWSQCEELRLLYLAGYIFDEIIKLPAKLLEFTAINVEFAETHGSRNLIYPESLAVLRFISCKNYIDSLKSLPPGLFELYVDDEFMPKLDTIFETTLLPPAIQKIYSANLREQWFEFCEASFAANSGYDSGQIPYIPTISSLCEFSALNNLHNKYPILKHYLDSYYRNYSEVRYSQLPLNAIYGIVNCGSLLQKLFKIDLLYNYKDHIRPAGLIHDDLRIKDIKKRITKDRLYTTMILLRIPADTYNKILPADIIRYIAFTAYPSISIPHDARFDDSNPKDTKSDNANLNNANLDNANPNDTNLYCMNLD